MRDSSEGQQSGQTNRIRRNSLIRRVLIVAGTFFVGLGIVGIFIPILPTTPFLLLAAACYARSSERFYNWLLNHRWFAKYIRPYREGDPVKGESLIRFSHMVDHPVLGHFCRPFPYRQSHFDCDRRGRDLLPSFPPHFEGIEGILVFLWVLSLSLPLTPSVPPYFKGE